MEVVVKRLALPKKLRAEQEVVNVVFLAHILRIAHRHGGFDDHENLRINRQRLLDGIFYSGGIEVVGFLVVIRRRGDDDKLRRSIGGGLIRGGAKVQNTLSRLRLRKEPLDLIVLYGADELIELVRL